jgi:hypothetical protein
MSTPIVSGSELSVVATADSYTETDDPDVNHGGASSLYSYYYEYELFNETTSYEKHTWLKFDLSEIPLDATVNSIALRMHTFFSTDTTNKVGVFLCSNTDWEELEITWNNCPEVTGQPIDTVYVGSSDTDYDFDVTSAVKGKGAVTLVLRTLEPTELVGWADFISKEYTLSKYHPRLVVEYTTPSTPLDFTFLIMISVGIIAVIIVVAYGITKRKKLPSPSETTTSYMHFWRATLINTKKLQVELGESKSG